MKTWCTFVPAVERMYQFTVERWQDEFGKQMPGCVDLAEFDLDLGLAILARYADSVEDTVCEDIEFMFRDMEDKLSESMDSIIGQANEVVFRRPLDIEPWNTGALTELGKAYIASRSIAFMTGMLFGRLASFEEFAEEPIADNISFPDVDDTINFIGLLNGESLVVSQMSEHFVGNDERIPLEAPQDPDTPPRTFVEGLLVTDIDIFDKVKSQLEELAERFGQVAEDVGEMSELG